MQNNENFSNCASSMASVQPSQAVKQSRRKRRIKECVCAALWYVFLTLLAMFFLFPYVFMLNKSLMTGKEAAALPIKLFASSFNLSAYKTLFTDSSYLLWVLNTVKIVGFNMIAITFSASLVAFAFAKCHFWGKNVLFAAMMSTILLPGMVVQIPQYVMFARFRWLNTAYPLTIPNLFGGGAMYIFLLRQFMRGIPKDLDNAATIDGANAFRRFFVINMPLCKPILIYIMVTVFGACWSDYYGPLLYLKTAKQYTLAIGIFKDSITHSDISYVPIRMAAGVFMTFFPAVLFFIFQKQLIEGVTVTGLKG